MRSYSPCVWCIITLRGLISRYVTVEYNEHNGHNNMIGGRKKWLVVIPIIYSLGCIHFIVSAAINILCNYPDFQRKIRKW